MSFPGPGPWFGVVRFLGPGPRVLTLDHLGFNPGKGLGQTPGNFQGLGQGGAGPIDVRGTDPIGFTKQPK